jgi:large subunit ribosomal protein L13
MYRRHTGYPGGLKETAAEVLLSKNPGKLVREAVIGMLPKTKLGRAMRKKLKVYRGAQHPHQAQQPTAMAVSQ